MRGVFRVFLSEALKCLKQQNPYTFNVFLDVTSRFECNTILYYVALIDQVPWGYKAMGYKA